MNYAYQAIKGSACTGYYGTSGSGDAQRIQWSSIWDIDPTYQKDVLKGYSFIGLSQNLETKLSAIQSIPSTYSWTVSNSSAYKDKGGLSFLPLHHAEPGACMLLTQLPKGNVVYDFMTSDTKGDSTSSNAQELMLWLRWEGGQVPIGWAEGPTATIDGLFGKDGWKLYQGKNTDTGITVSSLLAPTQYADLEKGTFEGDSKHWLLALSKQGVFSESTYVNVGNAGQEPYWGTVTFNNTLGLNIDL
ncbi:concanavalin A-like lectin/glucanase domain-containing protein [Colletotrichum phormii]|uniref:Concanavalin A-like lectin/glucanase domain-containing protein n=1 Tax=Colletotrichum phormii TaxID=359342 RepID=A0AAI9ZKR2_9PEZI|nr:concanavalin A-like lectin/glucanase domain-containing protein [Colletotrichum phormii]KAK1625059.1 concanavalin A-like lectin/glucanase domain-containing protein [Colletotrichum phormii]